MRRLRKHMIEARGEGNRRGATPSIPSYTANTFAFEETLDGDA